MATRTPICPSTGGPPGRSCRGGAGRPFSGRDRRCRSSGESAPSSRPRRASVSFIASGGAQYVCPAGCAAASRRSHSRITISASAAGLVAMLSTELADLIGERLQFAPMREVDQGVGHVARRWRHAVEADRGQALGNAGAAEWVAPRQRAQRDQVDRPAFPMQVKRRLEVRAKLGIVEVLGLKRARASSTALSRRTAASSACSISRLWRGSVKAAAPSALGNGLLQLFEREPRGASPGGPAPPRRTCGRASGCRQPHRAARPARRPCRPRSESRRSRSSLNGRCPVFGRTRPIRKSLRGMADSARLNASTPPISCRRLPSRLRRASVRVRQGEKPCTAAAAL